MRTITVYLALTATLIAAPLPMSEQHRLAVYCAFTVATHENIVGPDGGGGSTYKVGDTCPECRGAGQVGDGTVMMKCIWSDGDYYCQNGKIAARGSASDSFGTSCCCDCDCGCESDCNGECGCDNCTCRSIEELWRNLEDAAEGRWNESTIRDLGDDLRRAIEEGQRSRADHEKCQLCTTPAEKPSPPETQQEKSDEPCLTSFSQRDWNWSGVGNPPLSVKRQHLINNHDVDPASANKMSNDEVEALHNLLHNSEVRSAPPQAKARASSGGCPNGQCPTSRGSSSSRRGFFGRFR